jgi:hypothetical protein
MNVGKEVDLLASIVDIITSIICIHYFDGIFISYLLLMIIPDSMSENDSALADRGF